MKQLLAVFLLLGSFTAMAGEHMQDCQLKVNEAQLDAIEGMEKELINQGYSVIPVDNVLNSQEGDLGLHINLTDENRNLSRKCKMIFTPRGEKTKCGPVMFK